MASGLKLTADQHAPTNNGAPLARVSDLPIVLRQKLCQSLDVDKGWKDLADAVGLTPIDVGVIEARCAGSMSSPADQLLAKYVLHKHPRVVELYTALIERKRFSEAQLIQHLVPANILRPKAEPKYSMELFSAPQAPKEKVGVQQKQSSFSMDSPREFSEPNMLSAHPGSNAQRLPCNGPSSSPAPTMTTQTSNAVSNAKTDLSSSSSLGTSATTSLTVRRFSYEEIRDATKNFSAECLIGQGRFSRVFKCTMQNTTYAVKEKSVKSGGVSLDMELILMQSYPHENILPIYGCCVTPDKVFLCCQFMANNSLADRLSSTSVALLCEERCHIAVGAARGLQYLHNLPGRPIIHGNVKSSNILLDKHLEAKLSDFALARFATGSSSSSRNFTGSGASEAKLTHYTKQDGDPLGADAAYTAPELIEALGCVQPSVASDTYSFGIVLLEMCTGFRASCSSSGTGGSTGKIDWLRTYVANACSARTSDGIQIADPRIAWDHEFFVELLQVAQSCCSLRKKDRPSVRLVLEILQESHVQLQIRPRTNAVAAAAVADPASIGSADATYDHSSTDGLSLNYPLSSNIGNSVATIDGGNVTADESAPRMTHIAQQLSTMSNTQSSSGSTTTSSRQGVDTSSSYTSSGSSSFSMPGLALADSSRMPLTDLPSPRRGGTASETSDDGDDSSTTETGSEDDTPPASPPDAMSIYIYKYGDESATGESAADLLLQDMETISMTSNEPTESSADD